MTQNKDIGIKIKLKITVAVEAEVDSQNQSFGVSHSIAQLDELGPPFEHKENDINTGYKIPEKKFVLFSVTYISVVSIFLLFIGLHLFDRDLDI